MPAHPSDSRIYRDFLGDHETAALLCDGAEIRAMLEVEAALARAQGACGVIPAAAARQISEAALAFAPAPESLAAGTRSAGVPVPALVAALRAHVGGEVAGHVHWGATSQDIMDTALILRLREITRLFDARLRAIIGALIPLAEAHRGTVMAARTRSQQATPTTFGLKVAGWIAPLVRHRQRLGELAPRLLAVQFGGAAGTLAPLGEAGPVVVRELGRDLGLAVPALPWHTARDSLGELAGWLALVTGTLGKIGTDLVLLAQSEVGEVQAGAGGGSSTLPQKANPVGAEALVTLARANAGSLASAGQAMLAEHERSGPAWTLEWMVLPQMLMTTGAALAWGLELAGDIRVDAARMRQNLEASKGLALAEAAAFALASHLPRGEAQALVKAACIEAIESGRDLFAVLAEKTDAPVDWAGAADPAGYLGAAGAFVDAVLAEARAGTR